MILGCIADDFTGATDLANTLTRHGMHTVQTISLPKAKAPEADTIVVALKSRTIPAAAAVQQSLEACRWLKNNGAHQIYFKYCSTFDSTDQGNIGPVAEALLDELKTDFTIFCPALPENGRTIYLGHLFVGNELLSDSGMRNHPLTPMRDSNLVRVLGRQTRNSVGLVPYASVRKGREAIQATFIELRHANKRFAIVDALTNDDLIELGAACAGLQLITGGSGAAIGLPENFRKSGLLRAHDMATGLEPVGGPGVVLSGSCSTATLQQVEFMKKSCPSRMIDISSLEHDKQATIDGIVTWAKAELNSNSALIYASADPAAVAANQEKYGRERAGEMIEQAMAEIARQLVAGGLRRLVVAGGETSGAVVTALGIEALEIGPQIDPGVPATLSYGSPRIALALKSGNFGGEDFFLKALQALK